MLNRTEKSCLKRFFSELKLCLNPFLHVEKTAEENLEENDFFRKSLEQNEFVTILTEFTLKIPVSKEVFLWKNAW